MLHFDNHLLEIVFWWSIVSAPPAVDEVTQLSSLFKYGKFINIVLHQLFQAFTSKVTDNMLQESIIQKVPVEIQFGPDVHNGYWWWNVGQILSNKALVPNRS